MKLIHFESLTNPDWDNNFEVVGYSKFGIYDGIQRYLSGKSWCDIDKVPDDLVYWTDENAERILAKESLVLPNDNINWDIMIQETVNTYKTLRELIPDDVDWLKTNLVNILVQLALWPDDNNYRETVKWINTYGCDNATPYYMIQVGHSIKEQLDILDKIGFWNKDK